MLESRAFRGGSNLDRQPPDHVWGGSSVGRASRSQCEGRGFDPLPLHHFPFLNNNLRTIFPLSARSTVRAGDLREIGDEIRRVHQVPDLGRTVLSRHAARLVSEQILTVLELARPVSSMRSSGSTRT